MDLHTASPYWLLKSGLFFEYPSLQQNIKTEYVIIGGGITGALIAWYLSRAGVSVVLLDRRHIGMGSTCASTSMLQYEIDTPMHQLAEMVGVENAARSYWLCGEAIDKLEVICNQLPVATDFEKKPSLYYASRKADLPGLKTELAMRQKHGFVVELLDQQTLQALFSFAKSGALYSQQGGQVDAYALTHGLLQDAIAHGAKVFDKTAVTTIDRQKSGISLQTQEGHTVRARKLVIAAGYESGKWLPKQIASLHSSYALVTEPYDQEILWHENALIWESARPYLYGRTTRDRRILIGGKDEPFQDAKRRDRLLARKSQQLVRDFEKLFPYLAPLKVDYHWAGTFAETVDGLPYIGSIPEQAHTIYALGFGGNGITFSQIAAELIRDEALGHKNPDAGIFSFNR